MNSAMNILKEAALQNTFLTSIVLLILPGKSHICLTLFHSMLQDLSWIYLLKTLALIYIFGVVFVQSFFPVILSSYPLLHVRDKGRDLFNLLMKIEKNEQWNDDDFKMKKRTKR